MHKLIFPEKDVSIYKRYTEQNMGLDEIIELKKELSYDGTFSYSRILIKFDLDNIPTSASNYYLNLFTSTAYELPQSYDIYIYAVSQSWVNGTGYPSSNLIKKDGASWNYRARSLEWDTPGGTYISSSVVSCSYNLTYDDIRVDVSDIIRSWISGTYDNNGFLLKLSDSHEEDTSSFDIITFYSTDTHTIYVPYLECTWDDSVYSTSNEMIFVTGSTQITLSGDFQSAVMSSSLTGLFTGLTKDYDYLDSTASVYDQSYYDLSIYDHQGTYFNVQDNNTNISGSLTGSISMSGQFDFSGSITELYVSSSNIYLYQSGSYEITSSYLGTVSGTISGSVNGISSGSLEAVVMATGSITSSGYLYGTIRSGSIKYHYQDELTGSYTGSSEFTSPNTTFDGIVNQYISGNLLQSATIYDDNLKISMKGMKPSYRYNTTVKFRLSVKERYQRKTFHENVQYNLIKYLPETFYYQIQDAYNDRVLIPFSDYTKVSLDGKGHFFNLSLSGFLPERYYRIVFKLDYDETEQFFDDDYIFKVVKR